MPSASDAWRAAISSAFTSCGSAPNLEARLSLRMIGRDAQPDEQVEVGRGTPSVARTIFSSSSSVSRLKVFTPCVEIGLGDGFLGLHRVHEAQAASGSVSATSRTSPSEATS